MPPPLPTTTTPGTAGALEREVKQAEKLKEALAKAKKEIVDTFGKTLVKEGKNAKTAYAEVQAAISAVSQELKGTTKNAKEYGEAVKKDTEAVLQFAKKHKLTLDEAMAMYKKVKGAQQDFVKGLTDRAKNWALGFFTLGSAAVVYGNRVKELREGQQLFLSQTRLTGEGAAKEWGKLQETVDAYRDVQRDASILAHRYGVSTEEVQEAQKGLAKALRGTLEPHQKLGDVLKRDTERLYQFSRVMGVDVKDAQDLYIDQVRQQGLSHEEANRNLGMMIASYDRVAQKVGKLGMIQKDEYLAVLKDMQAQMGPTQVSMSALTGGMEAFGEVARSAGMNAKQTQEFMGALPKIAKGLPRFFKQQLGGTMLRRFQQDSGKFIKEMTAGMGVEQAKAVEAQLKAITQSGLPIWEQQERFQEALTGTKEGMAASLGVVAKYAKTMPAYAATMLEGMGIPKEQVPALLAAARSGKLDANKLKAVMDKVGKKEEDPRKALNDNLMKNAGVIDRNTMRAEEVRGRMEALGKQYQELIPAIGGLVSAIRLMTAIQGAGGLLGVTKNLVGGIGGLGGKAAGLIGNLGKFGGALTGTLGSVATWAGGVAAAGAAGYAFGSWLDKKFKLSDKISDQMVAPLKKLSEGKRLIERGHEHLQAQTARVSQQAERVRKYGRSQMMSARGELQETTAANVRAKEMTLLQRSLKQGEINQQQFDILVKALDASLKKFPTPKKMEEAKKPEEQKKVSQLQTQKAEHREEKARAKMQVIPGGRAQVPGQALARPAEAPQAAAAQGVGAAQAAAAAAPGTQQPTQQTFDPATGMWILQISTRDPIFQQMMTQSVAQAQQNLKRAR